MQTSQTMERLRTWTNGGERLHILLAGRGRWRVRSMLYTQEQLTWSSPFGSYTISAENSRCRCQSLSLIAHMSLIWSTETRSNVLVSRRGYPRDRLPNKVQNMIFELSEQCNFMLRTLRYYIYQLITNKLLFYECSPYVFYLKLHPEYNHCTYAVMQLYHNKNYA